MKIIVCIKQVPDTETKIKIGSDGASIDTNGIKWVMNPYDEFAVEEAIKIRDANPGSQAWAITVGPKKRAGDVLRTALAMGLDEGILVDSPENIDANTAAAALAATIKAEGAFDIILTGKLAIDDNAASTSQILAEKLGVPHATVVSKLTISSESFLAERDVEGGAKEVVSLIKPALVAANKGLNMPRYASLPGIMKAKKKVLKEIDVASLGLSSQNKLKIAKLEMPAEKPPVKMLAGDSGKQVSDLVVLLRDEAKVL